MYTGVERQSGALELLKRSREGSVIGVVYRGKVVENVDPSGTGRVKVWIPALYPSLDPYTESGDLVMENVNTIPWALPCFASASYNAGSFIVPQIGDSVWVLFENNDIFRPVYIGFMYTTGAELSTPVGSSYAPAYENNVPVEGVNPNHYIVMKTPKGSGLWMNDEDGTAHFYSANGGSIDFSDDRSSLAFSTGGSISSQDKGILLMSPEEGTILITDEGEEGPQILLQRGETLISMVEGQKIDIRVGDKEISVNEEEDLITIHYSDDVKVNLGDDSILVNAIGAKVELSNGNISISGDNVDINASGVINLNAPVVNFPGKD